MRLQNPGDLHLVRLRDLIILRLLQHFLDYVVAVAVLRQSNEVIDDGAVVAVFQFQEKLRRAVRSLTRFYFGAVQNLHDLFHDDHSVLVVRDLKEACFGQDVVQELQEFD